MGAVLMSSANHSLSCRGGFFPSFVLVWLYTWHSTPVSIWPVKVCVVVMRATLGVVVGGSHTELVVVIVIPIDLIGPQHIADLVVVVVVVLMVVVVVVVVLMVVVVVVEVVNDLVDARAAFFSFGCLVFVFLT